SRRAWRRLPAEDLAHAEDFLFHEGEVTPADLLVQPAATGRTQSSDAVGERPYALGYPCTALPSGEGARGDVSASRVLNGNTVAGHRRRRAEEGPGDNAGAVRRAGQIAAEDRAGAGQRGGVVRAVEIGDVRRPGQRSEIIGLVEAAAGQIARAVVQHAADRDAIIRPYSRRRQRDGRHRGQR